MKSFCCCPLFAAYAALGVCVTLHNAMENNADGLLSCKGCRLGWEAPTWATAAEATQGQDSSRSPPRAISRPIKDYSTLYLSVSNCQTH
jgi:hypothetical protein